MEVSSIKCELLYDDVLRIIEEFAMSRQKHQKRTLIRGNKGKRGKIDSNADDGLRLKEKKVKEVNILECQKEMFKRGFNNPDLKPNEKEAMMEWQELMKQMRESSKLFCTLADAAKESPGKFQNKVTEFYNALLFIVARTSDSVLRLSGMVENIHEAVKKQQDLYEKQRAENDKNNKESKRLAKKAIWIAVASLLVSVIVGIASCAVAHRDSVVTSKEIVQTIRECCGRSK